MLITGSKLTDSFRANQKSKILPESLLTEVVYRRINSVSDANEELRRNRPGKRIEETGLHNPDKWGGATMESWRLVWRDGFVPVLSTSGLEALRDALRGDDPRLTQGSTTTPPPLMCVQDWPVEAACALGFCGWQGDELESVGQVEEFFARACFEADQRLGEPAACRWFLNWFDDTPRDEMRRELLAEVEKALGDRTRVRLHPVPDPAAA